MQPEPHPDAASHGTEVRGWSHELSFTEAASRNESECQKVLHPFKLLTIINSITVREIPHFKIENQIFFYFIFFFKNFVRFGALSVMISQYLDFFVEKKALHL